MPSGYIIGRTDLGVSLASHAEMVPITDSAKRDNRKPDPAKDAEYARQLAVATEWSLRSPRWCPVSCPIDPQDPWACDHGEPLADRERWPRGSTYTAGAAGRADLAAPTRPPGRVPRSKTHCPKGHPYDQANTYWQRGHRKCRACLHTSREAAR